jgi:hypothetical protein
MVDFDLEAVSARGPRTVVVVFLEAERIALTLRGSSSAHALELLAIPSFRASTWTAPRIIVVVSEISSGGTIATGARHG